MVVSINDAVEAVLPVPCPAHRVVRVAFLEPFKPPPIQSLLLEEVRRVLGKSTRQYQGKA